MLNDDLTNKLAAVFGVKDLGNAAAIIAFAMQDDSGASLSSLHGKITEAIDLVVSGHVQHDQERIPCPECGKFTVRHGCKARKCEFCGHQYKPDWRKLERFGR